MGTILPGVTSLSWPMGWVSLDSAPEVGREGGFTFVKRAHDPILAAESVVGELPKAPPAEDPVEPEASEEKASERKKRKKTDEKEDEKEETGGRRPRLPSFWRRSQRA